MGNGRVRARRMGNGRFRARRMRGGRRFAPLPTAYGPHGDSHAGSPALDAFHSAKSLAERFSPLPALCVPSLSAISASVA